MMNHAPLISPAVSLRRYGAIEASDVHPFHQIVLGLEGAMDMAVDGIERRVDGHGAWIVPAGVRHAYSAQGVNRQWVVDLPVASVAMPERFFERARLVEIDVSIAQMIRRMASAVGPNGGSRRFAWEAATHVCAALIADAAPLDARGLDFARIDRWMRARLSEPLRIADLAAHCGFGMRRFHQVFCEAFGETPHRYLQRLRLDTALTLLADPRETLTDVALQTGFADQSAFTHAFTRRFGMAPGQWRAGTH
jgi:transcriptional regulator GlxA family with amidase domain